MLNVLPTLIDSFALAKRSTIVFQIFENTGWNRDGKKQIVVGKFGQSFVVLKYNQFYRLQGLQSWKSTKDSFTKL